MITHRAKCPCLYCRMTRLEDQMRSLEARLKVMRQASKSSNPARDHQMNELPEGAAGA